MAQTAPRKVFPLLNLYLDEGEKNLSGRSIDFQGIPFTARVISYGVVDRSIPYPPGQLQVNDTQVELADVDNTVKDWFDTITPFRRLGEIVFEFEENADDELERELPLESGVQPVSEPRWTPLYTGEIVNAVFPPGLAIITLRDTTTSWLNRPIPKLITRDNFPNLPDDLESAFAPIIFGRVNSFDQANIGKQGVILCPHVDTDLNYFCVARHTCHAVNAVYRRKHLESRFKLVNPLEYEILEVVKVINGVSYTFTIIHFFAQQKEGTTVHADVSGVNYRYDFASGEQIVGGEQRDPVDAIMNLIYFLLQNEARPQRFNIQSFANTRAISVALGMLCDGAITDNLNVSASGGITPGQALSWICGDFGFDFYQSNFGEMTLKYYDSDPEAVIPIDGFITLKGSVTPQLPEQDKVKNRLRYRYYRQNAGLTDFRVNTNSGQWGDEQTIDNVTDQDELLMSPDQFGFFIPQNPLLEEEVELRFVRDEDVALDLMKRRIGWHTLRSYPVEFQLPLPDVIKYIQLATELSFTHYNGIGADGWEEVSLKVVQVAFDLSRMIARVKAVRYIEVPEPSLDWSWDGSHPAHDPQVRLPHLPVEVNSASSDRPIGANFNDDLPPAPPAEDVTVDIIFWTAFYEANGYTPTDAEEAAIVRANSTQTVYQNVKWQEDETVEPRDVSGYVGLGSDGTPVKYYVGTIFPDTRPDDLDEDDIFKVKFYAWDFHHEYWWVGTGELFGTPSGWFLAVGSDEPGTVHMRMYTPATRGWHKADGTASVRFSDYKGDTALDTCPNAVGAFIKGTNTYLGPTQTAAVAPTVNTVSASGSHTHPGSSVGSHSHTIGGSTGNAGAHTPTVLAYVWNPAGGIHPHNVDNGTLAVASAGAHTHSGSTVTTSNHTHGYSFTTSTDGAHNHTASGSDSINDCVTVSEQIDGFGTESAVFCGATVDFAGVNISSDGNHNHTHEGVTGSDGGETVGLTIVSDGGHGHSLTGAALVEGDGEHDHSGFFSLEMNSVADHSHTLPANTGSAAPSLSIASDGSHVHTVTINADGQPLSIGLIPYVRL